MTPAAAATAATIIREALPLIVEAARTGWTFRTGLAKARAIVERKVIDRLFESYRQGAHQ